MEVEVVVVVRVDEPVRPALEPQGLGSGSLFSVFAGVPAKIKNMISNFNVLTVSAKSFNATVNTE